MKFLVALLLTASSLFAGDFTYGGFVGLKAPQKELKELVNSSPGTSVGLLAGYEAMPGHTVRLLGGYDFFPQYTNLQANYVTVAKTGSWNLGLDYQYQLTKGFYGFAGVGVKRWVWDTKTTYTHDLYFWGVKRDTYRANKVYGHLGAGYSFAKYFALEGSYTFGKIAENMTAHTFDARFIVKI